MLPAVACAVLLGAAGVYSQEKAQLLPERPIADGAVQSGLVVLPSQYPSVYRNDSFVEEYAGYEIPDPYRWLEETDSPETISFLEAQNKLTFSVLESQCQEPRLKFKRLMSQLYDYPKIGVPFQRGEPGGVLRYYYSMNTGLQAQDVLYTQAHTDAPATVLLDPNLLSKDGTVAVSDYSWSFDGSMMAYNLASGGSDWQEIRVLRIDNSTGKASQLDDKLKNVKFSSTGWSPDNKGFFYNQYPAPEGGADRGTETGANKNQQLWYHRIGAPQDSDTFVLAIPEHPDWSLGASVTEDHSYMIIGVTAGTAPENQVWYIKMADLPVDPATGALDLAPYDFRLGAKKKALPLVKLVDTFIASFGLVANEGPVWTLSTDLNAPKTKLVRVNVTDPGPPANWTVIIPENPSGTLSSALALKGDALVTEYLVDVVPMLQLRSLENGTLVRNLTLPGIGSLSALSGRRKLSEMYFSFNSVVDPGSTYKYDTATPDKDPVLVRKVVLPGNFTMQDQFETKQVFVTSKDGTKVPMFVTARKDIKLDGSSPALLYGYGGFDIVTSPTFSVSRLIYMAALNGVYAIGSVRGGGELGIDWWKAADLHKKQNSYDDFAACAKWLQDNNYTSPAKLAIQGGSNGGLMMGVVTNQDPGLYGAVLAQVGVHDLLRFPQFTIGHAWISEYGDPKNVSDFPYVYAISPLENVRVPGGTHQYPAMILTTGDHDDRVVPLHSFKMIATLQHTLAGYPGSPQRNPLLLRVDVRAGHGGGKPTGKVIDEYTDTYGFIFTALRAKWVLPDSVFTIAPVPVPAEGPAQSAALPSSAPAPAPGGYAAGLAKAPFQPPPVTVAAPELSAALAAAPAPALLSSAPAPGVLISTGMPTRTGRR